MNRKASEEEVCLDEEEVCLDELPEGCISQILSFTTPLDACTLAAVSKTFLSAANSDDVWDKLLPSDLDSIISGSSSFSTDSFSSKKQLFLSLCHNPILIDNQTKSFSLEKRSGKKCYMIAARSLMISWGDTPQYWRWINDVPNSRFRVVAELRFVWWLDIRGRIDTSILSPETNYVAYLIFKLHRDAYGLDSDPIQATIGIVGGEEHTRIVHLVPDEEEIGSEFPKRREDGWLEVELGEYYNHNGEDGELDVRVLEVRAAKSGLVVQGIEIRLKLN